jgi:phosphoribosylformimino-5-aminoimidazole carboxamide ribotide isomerase
MHGQVVRGVGGRRAEYRPLRSRLAPSADPLTVARAFRDHFGLTELYLADLDAIAGMPPACGVVAALGAEGFDVAVDAGLRNVADAVPLAGAGATAVVAGLETLSGPAVLDGLVKEFGAARVIFSLDLRDGRPLTTTVWPIEDAWAIAAEAVRQGIRRLLVLDLARVGEARGTGTEAFCLRLATTFADVEILAGGGVRGRDDLDRLQRLGVKAVLVASALHDGKLQREDLG